MSKSKNKTPSKIRVTKRAVDFDQVDIESGSELGVDFDQNGFPKGTRDKRKLHEMKNNK